MWSVLVVIDPPLLEVGAGIDHGQGPGAENFLAQSAVERFYLRVFRSFSEP